jgi:hypothetical protein
VHTHCCAYHFITASHLSCLLCWLNICFPLYA